MNIRMGTKGKRPLRSLTPRDKIHAIQRIHDGESKASVARDIGVPESTLRGWCKNEDKLRFMSRQSAADKMCADALVDKLDGSAGLLGPPEKRQRLDNNSLPLNFSNKMNFDELAFKRSPLNGLDYSTNKSLSDMNYNGLPVDYVGFNGAVKNKVFGADISRPGQTDPSLNAISPLSSLTHLSGLSGISQSPLAISFNELTSNLNLLAQLNPGLAAMSGLNSFAATANTLRNPKPAQVSQSQVQSPRSDSGERERTPALSVKNWAKQKPSGNSLTPSDCDTKSGNIKSPSPSLAPSLVGCVAPLSGLPDDPLLYWLKSQQAMLGLNSLYPPPVSMGVTSPPIRSSTPQQQQMNQYANTPPIPSAPLTPSSTPSGSLDDKNTAWYNWCKAFGASLHSLNPNAATLAALQANSLQHHASSGSAEASHMEDIAKPPFENILYSQLTKETGTGTGTPSVRSLSSNEHNHMEPNDATTDPDADPDADVDADADGEAAGKPEDLSAKSVKTASSSSTPSPTLASPSPTSREQSPEPSAEVGTKPSNAEGNTVGEDCKSVLNNIIYKIGASHNSTNPINTDVGCDSETSFTSDNHHHHHHHHHNNNDVSASNNNNSHNSNNSNNNNNNNSNKTDEEERAKYMNFTGDMDMESADIEEVVAIRHGEKFLQWLENCSNPRVTAVQLMQLRFLIAAIKSSSDTPSGQGNCLAENDDNLHEDSSRNKSRRRK
ncbi:protein distal antenna [Drosophila innubila]|uniref:protein distal antenna n=1 Tax=Drosophila innubila TaxID=198719 RepID=UPI00148D29A6|nr:protein distal antenna [Drosophila innubila]